MREGRLSSLERWSQIDVSWNDASVEQTVHSVLDVVLSDGRWICEGIVSEVLGQDPLRLEDFVRPHRSNAQLLELNVADTALRAPILESIWLWQGILVS